MFVGHNRYCSFGLALSIVIDIALVVAICKVTIFMAISAQLFSPVLLLYLAMVMVNGDYGWLVPPSYGLKTSTFSFLTMYHSSTKNSPVCITLLSGWVANISLETLVAK